MIEHIEPIHVAYSNGVIRNAAGRMIAFYDYEAGLLYVDGIVEAFRVSDLEVAMDIVAERGAR